MFPAKTSTSHFVCPVILWGNYSLINPILAEPKEDLQRLVKYYWILGMNEKKIVDHVLDHFDRSKYGFRCADSSTIHLINQYLFFVWLSTRSLSRVCKDMGLKGTRQQKACFDDIKPFVAEIRARFPTMGARQMVTLLRQDYSMKVSEYVSPLNC